MRPAGLAAFAARALREALLLGTVVALYVALAFAVAQHAGLTGAIRLQLYSQGLLSLLLASLGALAVGHLLHLLLVRRPARPLEALRDDLRHHLRPVERLLLAVPVIALVALFMSAFSSWKVMLPELAPFAWDARFERWDRALHGGVAPWQWLQPLLGHPPITSMVNGVYNGWALLLYFFIVWQAVRLRDRALRLQFFLGFFLCWALLGSLAATAWSSAGPCYFGRVTGLPDPFAPLMDYLHAAAREFPVWSLDVQALLWRDYVGGYLAAGRGISAMPSMHVASTLLMTLTAWRTGRATGIAMTLVLAVILLGSVHLGWHYAIDGYLALALTYPLWTLAGHVARRMHAS